MKSKEEIESSKVAEKIKFLIDKANKNESKVHTNLLNSIMHIHEELGAGNPSNPQQRHFKILKEQQRIKKYFESINGGLVATPNEEILKTRNNNQATYYYLNVGRDAEKMRKRKRLEEKAITNFVSEREAFLEKKSREKRLMKNEDAIGSPLRELPLSQMGLDEFLKMNKIHPKIFTADTIIDDRKNK